MLLKPSCRTETLETPVKEHSGCDLLSVLLCCVYHVRDGRLDLTPLPGLEATIWVDPELFRFQVPAFAVSGWQHDDSL